MPCVLAQDHIQVVVATAEPRGDRRMQSQNRFFDDFARLAAGAMGALSDVKSEVEVRLREQFERLLAGMDLVSRDEFEAVKAMAAKARCEQEELAVKLAALEARLGLAAGPEAGTEPPPAGSFSEAAAEPPPGANSEAPS
jgi:BMFP domain-containing protein YqiC